jgi:hypothetical protein
MLVSEAAQKAERSETHPIPLVNAAPGPLASVLDLLELPERHGAESEELRAPLAGRRLANWGRGKLTPVMMA